MKDEVKRRDCWRVAVVAPLMIFFVEHLAQKLWGLL